MNSLFKFCCYSIARELLKYWKLNLTIEPMVHSLRRPFENEPINPEGPVGYH